MVLEGLMKALMTCDTIRDLKGFIKTPHGDMVEADDTKKSKKKRRHREEVAKAEAKKHMQEQAANKAAELVKKQAEEKKKGELQAAWSQVNADKRIQEASKKHRKKLQMLRYVHRILLLRLLLKHWLWQNLRKVLLKWFQSPRQAVKDLTM